MYMYNSLFFLSLELAGRYDSLNNMIFDLKYSLLTGPTGKVNYFR